MADSSLENHVRFSRFLSYKAPETPKEEKLKIAPGKSAFL